MPQDPAITERIVQLGRQHARLIALSAVKTYELAERFSLYQRGVSAQDQDISLESLKGFRGLHKGMARTQLSGLFNKDDIFSGELFFDFFAVMAHHNTEFRGL